MPFGVPGRVSEGLEANLRPDDGLRLKAENAMVVE